MAEQAKPRTLETRIDALEECAVTAHAWMETVNKWIAAVSPALDAEGSHAADLAAAVADLSARMNAAPKRMKRVTRSDGVSFTIERE